MSTPTSPESRNHDFNCYNLESIVIHPAKALENIEEVRRRFCCLISEKGTECRRLVIQAVQVLPREVLEGDWLRRGLSDKKAREIFSYSLEDSIDREAMAFRDEFIRRGEWLRIRILGDMGVDMKASIDSLEIPGKATIPLFKAVSDGDISVVKWLVEEEGLDPNQVDSDGFTPLLAAVELGNLEMVRYLVEERGADPSNSDWEGHTALGLALKKGHLQIVKWLVVKLGISFHKDDDWGEAILLNVVEYGHLDIVQWLVDEKGVNPRGDDEEDPLIIAAYEGHSQIVKWLLDKPEIISNEPATFLTSFLMDVVGYGHLEIVKYLVGEKGVDPRIGDEYGNTPLSCAVEAGELEVLRWLIDEMKVDLRAEGILGPGLLVLATLLGDLDIIQYLVDDKGVDICEEDESGNTSLSQALSGGSPKVAFWLVDKVEKDSYWKADQKDIILSKFSSAYRAEMLSYFLSDFKIDFLCRGRPVEDLVSIISDNPECLLDPENQLLLTANPLKVLMLLRDFTGALKIKSLVSPEPFRRYCMELSAEYPRTSLEMILWITWRVNTENLKAVPAVEAFEYHPVPGGFSLCDLAKAFEELASQIDFENTSNEWFCSPKTFVAEVIAGEWDFRTFEEKICDGKLTLNKAREILRKFSSDFVRKLREKISDLSTPQKREDHVKWWGALEGMVLRIAEHVQKRENPRDRVIPLLQLAGMGGRCGGIYGEVAQQYKLLFCGLEQAGEGTDSLERQLGSFLQRCRVKLLEDWMRHVNNTDVHFYNFLLKCLDEPCGLGGGAYDDPHAENYLHGFYPANFSELSTIEGRSRAWEQAKSALFSGFLRSYTPFAIVRAILNEINGMGKTSIDRVRLYDWFRENIQGFMDSKKKSVDNEDEALDEEEGFSVRKKQKVEIMDYIAENVVNEEGQFKAEAIAYLLEAMGILEKRL